MNVFHRQVLDLIIKPTLTLLDHKGFPELNTPSAVDLLYGTALAESGLREIEQEGGGPALGYWQMEPATHDDIWQIFLKHNAPLRTALIVVTHVDYKTLSDDSFVGDGYHPLVWNIRYGCAMARIHYLRQKGEIPGDAEGQAQYWLEHYNAGGKGSVKHYLEAWEGR